MTKTDGDKARILGLERALEDLGDRLAKFKFKFADDQPVDVDDLPIYQKDQPDTVPGPQPSWQHWLSAPTVTPTSQ